MKKLLIVACAATLVAAAAIGTALAAGSTSAALGTLQPGAYRTIHQTLPVNVVFVGYEPGTGAMEVDEDAFLAGLPDTYETIYRYPAFYGLPAKAGVDFTYDFDLTWADADFEDDFFGYLVSIADPQPLTLYQDAYNTQANRSLDVTTNTWIDAPSVEQWLADNAGELGVDTSQYTVFFVNWYGRDDFKFHVYTKTDEPDPDTGYNFGQLRESRKMIAWGGTTADDEENGLGSTHRIWFYDLSAGPESWTDNWAIDDAPGYTMPPVWEYGNLSGYRPFDDLSGDLGKVTRYVALDLLFTTSPLYKPALSGPDLPTDIQLDVNVYQADPASDGKDYFDTGLIDQELGELQPDNTFSTELNDADFSKFAKVYGCFYDDVSCYGQRLFGIAFADPFLYHKDKIQTFLEGDADYEVPVFAFNATDDLFTCCLGYADDDWATGTQSFVFAFDAPSVRDISGYGFTTTTIHEVGHHVGMSHPHDGYDSASGVDFGPEGDTYFAWSGDESNSMMSYIDLNWDFSQFDRDNMARYLTAIYVNEANVVLAKVLKSPRASRVSAMLTDADAKAAAALAKYGSSDWSGAASDAKMAYENVMEAAAAIGVKVEPQSYNADVKAKGRSGKFVDGLLQERRFRP